MELTDPTIINVVAQPTVKEQIVQAGVGLGIAAVTLAISFTALYAFGAIAEKVQDRKLRKLQETEK